MERKDDKEKEWGSSFPYALQHFSTSGGAVAVATAFTHPLDVVKVRLQMQLLGQRGPLLGMSETFGRIIKLEGASGLYLGLVPALTRSALYGGLRLGLYEPSKYLCDLMFGSTNIFVKIASGAFSGAFATALTNPMEVLKVRLQMNSRRGLTGEMRKIISEEGFRALWKGIGPAMTRASALTASQLATYDESKQVLLRRTHLEEGFHLHLISSFAAGSVGTLVTAPVDMIKTRLMLQQDSRGGRRYRNVFHCAYQVVLTEGTGALYKGFDDWKDPADEALAGGRGMFCVVPIAKGLLRMASLSINRAVESVAKALESSGQISPPALHEVLINHCQKVMDFTSIRNVNLPSIRTEQSVDSLLTPVKPSS